jgi:multimeric flavodoxin WrbA
MKGRLYMKIGLINGSPKQRNSVSETIINQLKGRIEKGNQLIELHFRTNRLSDQSIGQLASCDCLVFAFPLYVDGIPSHLLACLRQLEDYFSKEAKKELRVYCLVNCGFYEGEQTAIAQDIMKNWCKRATLSWGQGIGIGSGGMVQSVANAGDDFRLKRNFARALDMVSKNILSLSEAENVYINFNFPRLLYKLCGEMGWRKQIKNEGLKVKDLNRQIDLGDSKG